MPTKTNRYEKWNEYTAQFDASELRRKLYPGEHAIGRDTRIGGGVHGFTMCESIGVDTNTYSRYYDDYYQDAYERATAAGSLSQRRILHATFNMVTDRMQYSQQRVDDLIGRAARQQGKAWIEPGDVVDLAAFMAEGYGVCRHQALAVGVTLERFQDYGLLGGKISVRRGQLTNRETGEKQAHQWLRFTPDNARTGSGDDLILDVAQGYFGTLAESTKLGQWDYYDEGEEALVEEDWLLLARELGVLGLTASANEEPTRPIPRVMV